MALASSDYRHPLLLSGSIIEARESMASRDIDLEQRAAERLPGKVRWPVERLDRRVTSFLDRYGVVTLRIALGIVYIWFGALKVIDRSPVEDLVRDVAFF